MLNVKVNYVNFCYEISEMITLNEKMEKAVEQKKTVKLHYKRKMR